MLQIPVAKVAVLAATFAFDRPYTYKIPQPLADTLRPGCRVMVPFSRGNRPCEGMVLALDKAEDDPKLKPITRQLDPEPILSPELIRLAVWMHDRFFCTIYDALHAILPAGVWYRVSTVYCAAPELDAAAALAQCGRSKQRRLALETVLEHGGRCPLDELQAAFGDKDPASALHWLVEQKFLTVEGTQKRVVRDKQLEYASLAVPLEEAQEEIRRRRRAPHQGRHRQGIKFPSKQNPSSEMARDSACGKLAAYGLWHPAPGHRTRSAPRAAARWARDCAFRASPHFAPGRCPGCW